MSGQVQFFAAAADDLALRGYAQSLGLILVPGEWMKAVPWPDVTEPSQCRLCGFSAVQVDALHPVDVLPVGSGKVRVGWATDPIIEFQRSVVVEDAVIAGRLWWSDHPKALAVQTKPCFDRLRRWIGKTWTKRERDGYFIGPAAQGLAAEGYELLYLPRGVRVTSQPL
jgi:hypothetical protein